MLTQTVTKDTESNYEDEVSFDVLKPTIKKWLRGEKIRNTFTDASNESIRKLLGKDKSQLTYDDAAWFSNFRYEPTLIDLNNDGKTELAIRNNCAAVGNCQFWIFRRTKKGYETTLKTLPGSVQTFKVKSSASHGYFDLETTDHFDAYSGGIAVYRFSGKEYKIGTCFTYNYAYLKNGKLYTWKNARIIRVKC